MAQFTMPKDRTTKLPTKSQPGFIDLARLYLEGEGYTITKKTSGESFTDYLQTVLRTGSTKESERYEARAKLAKVYGSEYNSCKTSGVVKAAMGENTGTAGGYLVPQDYSTRILEVISEDSFLYPRANRIPMMSGEIQVPRIDVETVPSAAGTSPFFGGITFTWGSEQTPAETEPKFRSMSLRAWDLLGYAVISNQFLMDTGPAGEDALVKLFGKAAAWYTEYAFLQGTGTAQLMPLGIINSPAAVTVSRQVGNQISVTDIAAMGAALLPYSWKGAIWACSPTCLAQIVKIPSYFINMDAHEKANAGTLMTRPLFVSEKLAALGAQGDLLLFDPWLYTIGERMQILIDVSPHVNFRNFQTVFRIWVRIDGKPQVSKSITLQDTTTVVSPYVILK